MPNSKQQRFIEIYHSYHGQITWSFLFRRDNVNMAAVIGKGLENNKCSVHYTYHTNIRKHNYDKYVVN